MGVRTLCIIFLLLIAAPHAHAACSDPTGIEGDIVYNGDHNVVQFCTGAAWIAMGGGGGSGGTTTIGTLDPDKWCQADNTGSVINCTADAPSAGGKFVDGTDTNNAVYTTGNVGIKTAAPGNSLHVVGGTSLAPTVNANSPIVVEGTTANGNVNIQVISGNDKTSSLLFADVDSSAAPGYSGALMYNHATNVLSLRTNADATDRLVVDTNGRVGIGIATPNVALDVRNGGVSGTSVVFQLAGAGINTTQLISDANLWTILKNVSNGPLVIGTNNTERMRVDASGNVGIGTTTPSQKLEVSGTVKATELESRGSVIILKLNSCGGSACGGYHALNAWVNTGTYSLTWDTFLNTNPSLFSHTGNGHIIVNKAGVYRVTERHMMYSGSTHQYIYHCPYVNGVLSCGTQGWPPHGYYPGGYWYDLDQSVILELPAGADVTYGYYIYVAMTYWANDGYTQLSIERIN